MVLNYIWIAFFLIGFLFALGQLVFSGNTSIFNTLVEFLPIGIYAKDKQGRKTLANDTDLMFMSAENESEILNKTDLEIRYKC